MNIVLLMLFSEVNNPSQLTKNCEKIKVLQNRIFSRSCLVFQWSMPRNLFITNTRIMRYRYISSKLEKHRFDPEVSPFSNWKPRVRTRETTETVGKAIILPPTGMLHPRVLLSFVLQGGVNLPFWQALVCCSFKYWN